MGRIDRISLLIAPYTASTLSGDTHVPDVPVPAVLVAFALVLPASSVPTFTECSERTALPALSSTAVKALDEQPPEAFSMSASLSPISPASSPSKPESTGGHRWTA